MHRVVLFLMLSVLFIGISFADDSRMPALTLDEGTNEIALSLSNTSARDLASVSVTIENDALPVWLAVSSPERTIDIGHGEKSDDSLPLTFTVTGAPVGAEATIPLHVADADGNEWRFAVKARVATALPMATSLEANFPNPFNPSTTIGYRLNAAGDVKLTVYNAIGQVVRRLVDNPQAAGKHSVQWDGCDESGNAVSSGVYFYTLSSCSFKQTKRMMLVE